MLLAALRAASLLLPLSCAAAQDEADVHAEVQAQVQAWFMREWEAARAFPENLEQPLDFTYEVRLLYVPPPEELEAMRKQVEGRPDHPLRSELTEYDRRISENYPPFTYRAIIGGPTQWRLAVDGIAGPGMYADMGREKYAAWSLSPKQVHIAPVDPPVPGYAYAESVDNIKGAARALLYQGIGIGPPGEPTEPPRLSVSGRTWTAEVGYKDWSTFRYEGVWDADTKRGTVLRTTVIHSDTYPEDVGFRIEYGGHVDDQIMERRVATVARHYRPDSRVEREQRLRSVEWSTQSQLTLAARVPSLDRPDPIRGPLTVDSIYDHRPDAPSWVRSPDTDEMVQTYAPTQQYRHLRLLGWVVLGVLILVVVILRLTRNARAGVQ